MDFVGVKLPSDAIARVNPDFIGKKGQGLVALVLALRSHGGVALCLNPMRKCQCPKNDPSCENAAEQNRFETFHHSSFGQIFRESFTVGFTLARRRARSLEEKLKFPDGNLTVG